MLSCCAMIVICGLISEVLMTLSKNIEINEFVRLVTKHDVISECRAYVNNAIRQRHADVMMMKVRRLSTSCRLQINVGDF